MGRALRRRGGGIIRSADMVVRALTHLGVRVDVAPDGGEVGPIHPETAIVWLYGSFEQVPALLRAAREVGAPLVVNSTFDDTRARAQAIAARLAEWDPEERGDVYVNVFSYDAEHSPLLHAVRGQVVTLPKTLRAGRVETPPRVSRRGICVGDVAKTFERDRLVTGLDVARCVASIQVRFPDVPVVAYRQYGTNVEPPPGVEVLPYQPEGFVERLGRFLAYVSFARHETFAMVPLEAQSVGTPVLYRHMPQSLSEYIGAVSGLEGARRAARRAHPGAGLTWRAGATSVRSISALWGSARPTAWRTSRRPRPSSSGRGAAWSWARIGRRYAPPGRARGRP